MASASSQSIVLSLLNFIIINGENYQVESKPKEVIPVPGWFNNVEGFILPNLEGYESTEPVFLHRHVDNAEFFKILKKKKVKRKRKRTGKKFTQTFQDDNEGRKKPSASGAKKKKRKSRGHRLKFIKSDAIGNLKDSKVSESKEKHPEANQERNPVDIIVHIKMTE